MRTVIVAAMVVLVVMGSSHAFCQDSSNLEETAINIYTIDFDSYMNQHSHGQQQTMNVLAESYVRVLKLELQHLAGKIERKCENSPEQQMRFQNAHNAVLNLLETYVDAAAGFKTADLGTGRREGTLQDLDLEMSRVAASIVWAHIIAYKSFLSPNGMYDGIAAGPLYRADTIGGPYPFGEGWE